jgi:nicotinamide-nucleotide amidase
MDITKLLTDKKLKITTAESCTGGLIAKVLTDRSGASQYFGEGYVTYSNEAKRRLLGVKGETLEKYGAVSAQTAAQMCEGAMAQSGADIALSVTGIAGPEGGTPQKPVGLVYIGVCGGHGTQTGEYIFSGTRDEVRRAAAQKAIQIACEYIVQYY